MQAKQPLDSPAEAEGDGGGAEAADAERRASLKLQDPVPENAPVPESAGGAKDPIEGLRSTIDASVFGTLDPGAVLDAAESLLALDVSESANPEPAGDGALHFPLLGTPDGVQAQLVVAPSVGEFAGIVSLNVQFDPPEVPYMLGNALRAQASTSMTTWTDAEGNLMHLAISTQVQPHYKEMLRQGMDFNEGTIQQGVLYHWSPDKEQMKAHGMREGGHGEWEAPVFLEGEPWPQVDRMKAMSSRLLSKYQEVKDKNER